MNINKTLSSALLFLAVCLIAACSDSDSTPATTAPATNATVVAHAGSDQSVYIGTFVTLNGSNSTNANGTGLTYAWTMNKPVGSNAALSNPNIVNPTFTPDIGGTYQCTLVVRDAQNLSMTSAPSTTIITADGTNPPPVANAGLNQDVYTGKVTFLNGNKSHDPNQNPISYKWTFKSPPGLPAGSAASLLDAATVAPTFTPDVDGDYVIQLIVNDGVSDSTPSFVTVTAGVEPLPTANAGPDQIQLPGTLVTLDGSQSSDAAGDPLTYSWTVQSKPQSSTLTNADLSPVVKPTFTPDVVGAYVVQLVVSDGPLRLSVPDSVMITVGPAANAGPDQTVQLSNVVTLDGSSSFGASLTYLWSFTQKPTGSIASLSNATTVNPTFIPDVAGTYVIKLTVTDSIPHTASDSVVITAGPGPIFGNPSIIVSPSGQVSPNTPVTLTANVSGTTGTVFYSWTSNPATNVTFTPPTAKSTEFKAAKAEKYVVTVTVTDEVTSRNAQVTIDVNTPPKIVKLESTNNTPGVCTANTVSWSATDDDGDLVTVKWQVTPPSDQHSRGVYSSQIVGASTIAIHNNDGSVKGTINNPAYFNHSASATGSATFMPDVKGTYSLTLTADDGKGGSSSPSTITLTADRLYTTGFEAFPFHTTPTILTGYQVPTSCISCHKLDLWGVGTAVTGPEHSGKGLQALSLVNGNFGNSVSTGNPVSHTGGSSSLNSQDLCNLFNDYDRP